MCMNNSALKDIQQSLNIIRTEIVKVDDETKMAALELIMSTSQSVVAMARKLTKPKVRTKVKKVVIPKTKIVKQRVAQPTQEKEPQNKSSIIKPIKPISQSRSIVPKPPVRTTPPITAAAIASNSFKFPFAVSAVLTSNT